MFLWIPLRSSLKVLGGSGCVSISPDALRATPQEYFTALQARRPSERLVPLVTSCPFRKPSLMRPPYQAATYWASCADPAFAVV